MSRRWLLLLLVENNTVPTPILFHTGAQGYASPYLETMSTNPRYSNGNYRRKCRARFKAMDAPCGICHGKLGPIHYDEPSDSAHPLSFVIDEIKPVSKWKQFGYDSPEAACHDWNNLQAAHYCCNQAKGAKMIPPSRIPTGRAMIISDGDW